MEEPLVWQERGQANGFFYGAWFILLPDIGVRECEVLQVLLH